MNSDSSSFKIKDANNIKSISIEKFDNINNLNINNNEVNDFDKIRDQNHFNIIIENAFKVSINSSQDSVLNLIGIEKLFEKYKCFYKEIKNLIISKEEEKKCENFDCEKQLDNEMKYIIIKIKNLASEHNKNKLKRKLIKSSEQSFFIKAEIIKFQDFNNNEINILGNILKNQGIKIENENKNTIKNNINNNINDNNYNIKEDKINKSIILPELIPPKEMINIFIHCVKHFE